MTAPGDATVDVEAVVAERAAIVAYLNKCHDDCMFRAGWVRRDGHLVNMRPQIGAEEHNRWVSKANAIFDVKAAIEHGDHLAVRDRLLAQGRE